MQIETNKQMADVNARMNRGVGYAGNGAGALILLFAIVGIMHHTRPSERGPRLAELLNGAIYLSVLAWLGSGCRGGQLSSRERENMSSQATIDSVQQRNVAAQSKLACIQTAEGGLVYTDGRPVNEIDDVSENTEDVEDSVEGCLAPAV